MKLLLHNQLGPPLFGQYSPSIHGSQNTHDSVNGQFYYTCGLVNVELLVTMKAVFCFGALECSSHIVSCSFCSLNVSFFGCVGLLSFQDLGHFVL